MNVDSQKAERRNNMFEITEDISWQVRKKRAKERLTIQEASKQIGITRQTLRLIENGSYLTKKSVFVKLTNWLLTEKEG